MTALAFVALFAVASPVSDDIASPWRDYWRTRRAECNAGIERIVKINSTSPRAGITRQHAARTHAHNRRYP